jgi:HK97 family phage prohead protease
MNLKHKDIRLDIKAVTEEGTFEGLASVYGNVDYGGDVVVKGAFAKSLKARPEVPILWQHDRTKPIGKGTLIDGPEGLEIKGRLTQEVAQAKEARALMLDGVLDGLSIGYMVDADEVKGNTRLLKEISLFEVSLVTFPMNEEARVTGAKAEDTEGEEVIFLDQITDPSTKEIEDLSARVARLEQLLAEKSAEPSSEKGFDPSEALQLINEFKGAITL